MKRAGYPWRRACREYRGDRLGGGSSSLSLSGGLGRGVLQPMSLRLTASQRSSSRSGRLPISVGQGAHYAITPKPRLAPWPNKQAADARAQIQAQSAANRQGDQDEQDTDGDQAAPDNNDDRTSQKQRPAGRRHPSRSPWQPPTGPAPLATYKHDGDMGAVALVDHKDYPEGAAVSDDSLRQRYRGSCYYLWPGCDEALGLERDTAKEAPS